MHFSSLPTALVALLLTTLPAPVTFNLPGTHAQSQFRDHSSLAPLPTSTNDPFRPVALLKPKREDPPICCLRPAASSLEPDDSEVFLSFEEWKAKRAAEAGGVRRDAAAQSASSSVMVEQQAGATPDTSSSSNGSASSSGGGGPVVGQDNADGGPASFQATDQPHSDSLQTISPHFRVPIIDRFNYASLDCSARVHSSHKSAKSAYNILSSKKDRYMLSPCPAPGEKQYVVVELCEDIVIDTVQLANFEFFSGVFREFTVSVAKTHVSEGPGQVGLEEWTVVGTYIGRNLRGVQSFHPPTSIRDFYRFIRIDFHSHYGNEYYCPISLLRVYGLTHLEQWKWDEWEAASRAKLEQNNIVPPPPVVTETIEEVPPSSSPSLTSSETQTSVSSPSSAHEPSSSVSSRDNVTVEVAPSGNSTEETPSVEATPTGEESDTITFRHSTDIAPPLTSDETPSSDVPTPTPSSDSTPTNTQSDASRAEESPTTPSTPSNSSSSVITSTIVTEPPTAAASSSATTTTTSTISLSATNLLSLPPLSSPLVHPPHPGGPPPSTGAESIYRTIMNRLTALEANTTLYARYVEEQTAGIRDVLRRMGEDVGRLEGMGRAREQVWRRERGEMERMERERRRVEGEVGELVRRVEVLVDEIVLEKRLGIAQLCLLLALLVFMTLTRGSRSDHIPANARLRVPGMREWGRRNLSFSGDWVSKLRNRSGSRNASVAPTLQGRSREPSGEKHKFPSTGSGSQELLRPPEPRPSGSSAPALPNITPHPSNPQLPPSAPQLTHLPQSIRRDRDSRSSGSTSTVVPRPITPSHPLTLSLSARPRTPRRLNARHHSHNHDRHAYSRYPGPPTTPLRSSSMTFLPAQISASTSTPVGGVGVPTIGDSGGGSSEGGGGGGGRVLVGPVPRSAKKWARSAHLHEVRRVVVQSPSLSLSPPMPEEDEGGADGLSSGSGSGGDLTDTGRGGVVIRSVGSRNEGDVGVVEVLEMNGKGKQKGGRVGSVLGPPFEEGVRHDGEGNGEVDSGEETWVDTDADSEVEGEKQSGG